MSGIKLTAAAWVSELRLGIAPGHLEPELEFHWKLRAEVCVADAFGKPLGSLPKSAWGVHVTDYNGQTQAPSFTLTRANVAGQVIPGYYILTVDDLPLLGWYLAPTSLGVVLERKGSQGQIVVPVAISGVPFVHHNAPWTA